MYIMISPCHYPTNQQPVHLRVDRHALVQTHSWLHTIYYKAPQHYFNILYWTYAGQKWSMYVVATCTAGLPSLRFMQACKFDL